MGLGKTFQVSLVPGFVRCNLFGRDTHPLLFIDDRTDPYASEHGQDKNEYCLSAVPIDYNSKLDC